MTNEDMKMMIGKMYWDLTEPSYAVYKVLKKDSYLMSMINGSEGSKKVIRRCVTISQLQAKASGLIEKSLTQKEAQDIITLIHAMTMDKLQTEKV